MKLVLSCLTVLGLSWSASALADVVPPEPPPAPAPETAPEPEPVPTTDGPCKKLADACTAAGFSKGAHKTGKGLYKDCLIPLLDGKAVEGVTVEPADVDACKVKRAEHKGGKGKRGGKGG